MLVHCKLTYSGFQSGHFLSGRLFYPDGTRSKRVRCYYQYSDRKEYWDVVVSGGQYDSVIMDELLDAGEDTLFQLSCTVESFDVYHIAKIIEVMKMYKSDNILDYNGIPDNIGVEL